MTIERLTSIKPVTILYEKKGRRYIIWGNTRDWNRHDADVMRVGEVRMEFCPEPGCYRYRYGVELDRATFIAAALTAQHAMEEAIHERAKATPSRPEVEWTPEQIEIINKFREDMAATGALVPYFWTRSTPFEIAMAGIDAVIESHFNSTTSPGEAEDGDE